MKRDRVASLLYADREGVPYSEVGREVVKLLLQLAGFDVSLYGVLDEGIMHELQGYRYDVLVTHVPLQREDDGRLSYRHSVDLVRRVCQCGLTIICYTGGSRANYRLLCEAGANGVVFKSGDIYWDVQQILEAVRRTAPEDLLRRLAF